jgi:threonine dehydrogenase-like Zn-dependent dehydrogenase
MRAGQFFGKGDIYVIDVPKPKPRLGEAIVDVKWCGIYSSDLYK